MARWTVAVRAIAGIPVDRARLRLTATYTLLERLRVGVEYNPLADDVGLPAPPQSPATHSPSSSDWRHSFRVPAAIN